MSLASEFEKLNCYGGLCVILTVDGLVSGSAKENGATQNNSEVGGRYKDSRIGEIDEVEGIDPGDRKFYLSSAADVPERNRNHYQDQPRPEMRDAMARPKS